MVRGLRKPGDLLARSDLCHLHDGREEAEACAIEPKLPSVKNETSCSWRGPGRTSTYGWSAGRCLRSSTAVCAGGLTHRPLDEPSAARARRRQRMPTGTAPGTGLRRRRQALNKWRQEPPAVRVPPAILSE